MPKLNQLLAVEKGAKQLAERTLTDTHHLFQRTALMAGLSRAYRPKDDEGEQLPGERTLVQVRADECITRAAAALTRWFDIAAQKDFTNCIAKADVVVDGETVLVEVPVTYLLWLERQLQDLLTFFRKAPTLDPAEEWSRDAASDTWRSAGQETTRTKKVPRNHVKSPATDKHPAQVEVYTEDVVAGYWSTVKFSGALPAQRVNVLIARTNKLLQAVKMAREGANGTNVLDVSTGDHIFNYLLREGY